MDVDEFDSLVDAAWNELPQTFRDKLENVEIVVEEYADAHTLRMARVRNPMNLLGFYHGVPLPERGAGYSLVAPDKISLYRIPIAAGCRTTSDLRDLITRVLRHEIAHHFGISDARLREIGAY